MKYTKQQWYTPAEIAVHNQASDCWVSINGKVYDLTKWLEKQFKVCKCVKTCSCLAKTWYCDNCVEYCPCFKQGYFYCDGKRLAMTILAYAGKDLSHWFKDGEWRRYTHPIVGSSVPYHVHGHGVRQPVVPSTRWRPVEEPWWSSDKYVVGKATAKTRPIRITNTLTGSTVTLEVCSEETIYEIMMRYLPHNSHLMSYSWRYMGKGLCLHKTLDQNGIPDERDRFSDVALAENMHIPAILLYYNDDLTEDPPKNICYCKDPKCVMKRPERCFPTFENK
ncbi:cytochrome b5 domain-containing protein 1 [Helicoverpa zea]|uniref:cytochrome b5 domain-containing protein 1 n=1 Tax=Helicoverpa zea TaxID=7113 RepID=UPI001F5AAC41|nr:cytochrome b5 domain-containing protein 1 [Helicoverpa zea]